MRVNLLNLAGRYRLERINRSISKSDEVIILHDGNYYKGIMKDKRNASYEYNGNTFTVAVDDLGVNIYKFSNSWYSWFEYQLFIPKGGILW